MSFLERARLGAFAIAASALVACGDGGLVGGDCATGLTSCELACFDLASDPAHCGACDRVCGAGVACVAGSCVEPDDGGLDARADADDASDGSADASDAADAGDAANDASLDGDIDGASDAGSDASNDTSSDATGDASLDGAGDASADSSSDASNDIVADTAGDAASDASGDASSDAADGAVDSGACASPLVACGGGCVDLLTDELSCGWCGHICASGVCNAGTCVGAAPGHLVAVGLDYVSPQTFLAATRLLVNAVTISTHQPVRVLSYVEHADTTAATKLEAVVTSSAASRGRTVSFTVAGASSSVPSRLDATEVDVLFVHDQKLAAAGALASIGADWAASLDAFARAGGVVVVLDGGQGTHEMGAFLTASGVLSTTGDAPATSQLLTVSAPADAIGLGVSSPFLAQPNAISFETAMVEDATHVVVVREPVASRPVVVHTVRLP